MKKIIIIVIIGKNRIVNNHNWTLEIDRNAYSMYFKEVTNGADIAISEEFYFALPSKSPPYPGKITHVIATNPDTAELKSEIEKSKSSTVTTSKSVAELLKAIEESTNPLFFIGDMELRNELIFNHGYIVNGIIELQVDQDFSGYDCFPEPSPLQWQVLPVKTIPAGGNKNHSVTIRKYVPNNAIH